MDRLYQTDLGIHYGLEINATAIARDQDAQEIVKLVELVLGVMVESEHKNEYIGNIMKLDESTQRELMVILEGVWIQSLRTKFITNFIFHIYKYFTKHQLDYNALHNYYHKIIIYFVLSLDHQ